MTLTLSVKPERSGTDGDRKGVFSGCAEYSAAG